MRVKTIWHLKALLGWFLVCIMFAPLAAGAIGYVLSRYTSLSTWVYFAIGTVTGIVSTTIYQHWYTVYHFEYKEGNPKCSSN